MNRGHQLYPKGPWWGQKPTNTKTLCSKKGRGNLLSKCVCLRREGSFLVTNIDPKKPTFFVSPCNLTSSSTTKQEGTIIGDQKRRCGYYKCYYECKPAQRQQACAFLNVPGARNPPKGSPTTLPHHPTSQLLVETCTRKDGFLSFEGRLHILTQCAFSHNILPYQSSHWGSFSPRSLPGLFFASLTSLLTSTASNCKNW